MESGYQKEDKNQQERRHLQCRMEAEGQGRVGSLGLSTESAETLGPGRSIASGISRALGPGRAAAQVQVSQYLPSYNLGRHHLSLAPGSSYVCKGAP